MQNKIEKSAIIEPGAILGQGNYIGHFTYIGSNVILGDNNYVANHVNIGTFSQHSSQKYELNGYEEINSERKVKVGSNNVIREFVTIHLPTTTPQTQLGSDCYIMAYNHISHDSIISSNVILANNVQIGGHTKIHEFANIGLSTVVHQRSTIGAYSMVGMASVVNKDVLPFLTVAGNPIRLLGKINKWGMNRFGFSESEIEAINGYYFADKKNEFVNSIKFESCLNNFYKDSTRERILVK